MNMGGGQDWDTVVLRKKQPSGAALRDEAAVNAVSWSALVAAIYALVEAVAEHCHA